MSRRVALSDLLHSPTSSDTTPTLRSLSLVQPFGAHQLPVWLASHPRKHAATHVFWQRKPNRYAPSESRLDRAGFTCAATSKSVAQHRFVVAFRVWYSCLVEYGSSLTRRCHSLLPLHSPSSMVLSLRICSALRSNRPSEPRPCLHCHATATATATLMLVSFTVGLSRNTCIRLLLSFSHPGVAGHLFYFSSGPPS